MQAGLLLQAAGRLVGGLLGAATPALSSQNQPSSSHSISQKKKPSDHLQKGSELLATPTLALLAAFLGAEISRVCFVFFKYLNVQ